MRDGDLQKGKTYRDTSRSRQSRVVVLDEIEPNKDATYIVGGYVALTQQWEQAREPTDPPSAGAPSPGRAHLPRQPGSEAFPIGDRTEISDFRSSNDVSLIDCIKKRRISEISKIFLLFTFQ